MRQDMSIQFIVSAGPEFGLGHLRRMQAVARAYRNRGGKGKIDFYLIGCGPGERIACENDERDGVMIAGDCSSLTDLCQDLQHAVIIFDLHKKHIGKILYHCSQRLRLLDRYVVAIDNVAIQADMHADLRWVPSFYKNPDWPDHLEIHYGWDHYLIDKKLETAPLPNKNRLLVLTGGSDVAGLGNIWPQMFERHTEHSLEIHWVQGPFSKNPVIPSMNKNKFILHRSLKGLDEVINTCDGILSVYGISVFESLMYGRPCVVYNPYVDPSNPEMLALKASGYVAVAQDADHAIRLAGNMFSEGALPTAQQNNQVSPIDGLGVHRLLERIN